MIPLDLAPFKLSFADDIDLCLARRKSDRLSGRNPWVRGGETRRGWNNLIVGNLFAYRAKDVRELAVAADPIGPENDRHLREMIHDPATLRLIFAWGPMGKLPKRLRTRWRYVWEIAKTRAYEDLIRCEAVDAMGGREPLDEAVSVVVTAYVAAPKSIKGQRRLDAMDGILKPVTRPDLDNYAKAALDGCNAIVFRDDSLVTDLIVRKRYSERPRLTITVETEADFG